MIFKEMKDQGLFILFIDVKPERVNLSSNVKFTQLSLCRGMHCRCESGFERRNCLAQMGRDKSSKKTSALDGSDAVMPPAVGQKVQYNSNQSKAQKHLNFSMWIREAVIFFLFLLLFCATTCLYYKHTKITCHRVTANWTVKWQAGG